MFGVLPRCNLGMMRMADGRVMISSQGGHCACQSGKLIKVVGPPLHHPSGFGKVLGIAISKSTEQGILTYTFAEAHASAPSLLPNASDRGRFRFSLRLLMLSVISLNRGTRKLGRGSATSLACLVWSSMISPAAASALAIEPRQLSRAFSVVTASRKSASDFPVAD